jgi:predicted Fe-Mo cluster-binding NifX family protein
MVKICISSCGKDETQNVDPRFGRASVFLFYDTIKKVYEAEDNPGASNEGGAGIAAAKFAVEKGANVVVTGQVGPNAFDVLSAAGVKIVTGASGRVCETIARYIKGELSEISAPTARPHSGMRDGQWKK